MRLSICARLLLAMASGFAVWPNAYAVSTADLSHACSIDTGPHSGTQVCGPNYVESFGWSQNNLDPAEGGVATLVYNFAINDSVDTLVTATLSFELFAQASGDQFSVRGSFAHEADASMSIQAANQNFTRSIRAFTSVGDPLVTAGGDVETVDLQFQTNSVYALVLRSSAVSDGVGYAYAFVDPVISIDTGLYPQAQIVVASEASNVFASFPTTAPIPEPHPAALLMAGMLALAVRGVRHG